MKRRKWDVKTKAMVVLEGLKGRSVADLCATYQIAQSQYYDWRDQFLRNATKAFETQQDSEREQRLLRENSRLKNLVGELTLELKKSDEVFS
jgi:transposase-like protein